MLADDDEMLAVIWTLTALVRDVSRKEYDPGQPRFRWLMHHAEALVQALAERGDDPPP